MKKIGLLLCAGVLAVGMTGCSGTASKTEDQVTEQPKEVEQEETPAVDAEEEQEQQGEETSKEDSTSAMDLYYEVLTNQKTFVSVDEDGKEVYLKDFRYINGEIGEDAEIKVTQFAVVDMDGDGNREVVLELDAGFDGTYEILHTMDSKVYGYNIGYRALNKLYDNGLCLGSCSAASWAIYQISFGKTAYEQKDVAGCNEGEYFLNGSEKASQQDYESYEESLTLAKWYTFNENNLQKQVKTGTDEEKKEENQNKTPEASDTEQKVSRKTGGYILAAFQYDSLSDEDVKYIPKDILRVARNEIYAQHGYIFTSADMKSFFENKTWYEPKISKLAWSDNTYLSKTERKNVQLISKYEKDSTVYEALSLTKKNGVTVASDGDFSIELPSAWNSDNFFL